jgi:hypothetical protein
MQPQESPDAVKELHMFHAVPAHPHILQIHDAFVDDGDCVGGHMITTRHVDGLNGPRQFGLYVTSWCVCTVTERCSYYANP